MADLLVHHWSHPTTPAGVGWDIVQTNVVRLITEKGFGARAALGEAEVIRVIVDDLDGTRDYKTLHRWYLVELATPGQQLVWNGYISDQWIDNGEEGDLVYPTGVGRRWELEITQENTLLGFRVIQGAKDPEHGVRVAESPGERLDWILGSDFLSTVLDHGLIDWDALNLLPDMDPKDYRGQTAADVCRDISLKTNFNHYIRYRDASSDIELAFYEPNLSTLDSSTLRVSNVKADIDMGVDGTLTGPTWPPFFGGYRLHRKGDRVSAGVLVQGEGVSSYGYSLDTSYEFGFRDMVVQDANTTTQAGADRLRNRLLIQHNEQDERITGLRLRLPAANLNDVKHGQRIEARFANLPGWEDFRPCRVVSKAFSRPDGEPQDRYDVDLELSPCKLPTCPEVDPTPTAYYPPFIPTGVPFDSFPRDPSDLFHYTKGGVPNPAGTINEWNFPDWHVTWSGSHEGFIDQSDGVFGNRIFVYPKGDGVMTVYALSVLPMIYSVTLLAVDGTLIEVVDDAIPTNTPYAFEVSQARDGLCEHFVAIDWLRVEEGGGILAFDGADWLSQA